jgi:F5/8 type C domain/Glycosyl hydrolases family 39
MRIFCREKTPPSERRRNLILLVVALLASVPSARAQTVRVDTNPSRAIPFDPDKALGTSIDILPATTFDQVYSDTVLKESLSAGWGPISYRQNTELTIEAWHWNPHGTWSDAAHESGYFTGSAEPGPAPLRESFGYSLPHRGTTRSDAGAREFSRLTDGDESTYWKSNPYLTKRFTGEDDALLPQWIVIDFGTAQQIDALRICWANPFATKYEIAYWIGDDAMNRQGAGYWTIFPSGGVENGRGGTVTLRLSEIPIVTRYIRISMTQSSNTCDTHGSSDSRNCVGYAVGEVYAGNFTSDGEFLDIIKHTPGQAQTETWVSSVDPWHTAEDRVPQRIQTGFDLFYKSGLTNHLPAMIPIAMIYSTPEDAAAEIAYIEKRGYPISFIEMGEEPDGAFMTPEDYAALYLEFATSLHRVDPNLKLGGPVFTGVNEDIKTWSDDQGRTSWLGRFVDYLNAHGRLNDLAFVSFEHYPLAPCEINWTDLYREAELTRHILQIWREDGVAADIPLMITESNISWSLTDPMQDTFAALWMGDSVGSFLANGGAAYYHSPIQPEPLRPGCHGFSTYGNFVADEKLHVLQHTSQYFASRLINLDWVKHGAGRHQLFPAEADLRDDAGHQLVTAYAVKRPDGEWSLLLINKDPSHAHPVTVEFADSSARGSGRAEGAHFAGPVSRVTFGAEQYVWHPEGSESHADPDGPPATSTIEAKPDEPLTLPRASLTILRGHLSP